MNFYEYKENISNNLILFMRKKGYTKLSLSKLTNIDRKIIDTLLNNTIISTDEYNTYIENIIKIFNLDEIELIKYNSLELSDSTINYIIKKKFHNDIDIPTHLCLLHVIISDASEAKSVDEYESKLSDLIISILELCNTHQIDLQAVFEQKMNANTFELVMNNIKFITMEYYETANVLLELHNMISNIIVTPNIAEELFKICVYVFQIAKTDGFDIISMIQK